jgi:ABC-type lipoprotein release transport system permease subunit
LPIFVTVFGRIKDSIVFVGFLTHNLKVFFVNPSFKYAKVTWDNAESSKYVMFEFLITLLVIMAVFAYIINSMTLNIEKKKIGIKYSFGISKFPIIVPYLIETILYIVTGIILSLLIVRVIYPLVCRTLIYTSVEGLLEYEFFIYQASAYSDGI